MTVDEVMEFATGELVAAIITTEIATLAALLIWRGYDIRVRFRRDRPPKQSGHRRRPEWPDDE